MFEYLPNANNCGFMTIIFMIELQQLCAHNTILRRVQVGLVYLNDS
jgi:hypothetical protein